MSLIESQKVKISVLNKTFEVDSEHLNVSEFLSAWLSGALKENEKLQVEIPIFNGIINSEVVIENIVKYMNITKGVIQDIVPYPLKKDPSKEIGPELIGSMRPYVYKLKTQHGETDNFEIADFIDVYVDSNEMRGLYEMIAYANYLDIKPLLYLCCAKMALMMKDKSHEEIKELVDC